MAEIDFGNMTLMPQSRDIGDMIFVSAWQGATGRMPQSMPKIKFVSPLSAYS